MAGGTRQLSGSAQGWAVVGSLPQSRLEGRRVRPAHLPANEEAPERRRPAETGHTRVAFNILHVQLNCKTILSVNTHIKNNKVINCREKAEFHIPNYIFGRSLYVLYFIFFL